jgi:hypothetical protein
MNDKITGLEKAALITTGAVEQRNAPGSQSEIQGRGVWIPFG